MPDFVDGQLGRDRQLPAILVQRALPRAPEYGLTVAWALTGIAVTNTDSYPAITGLAVTGIALIIGAILLTRRQTRVA